MTKELIEDNCKRCINFEMCQSTGCNVKNGIERIVKNEENLIKYLENLLTGKDDIDRCIKTRVIDLLEKVKSGKYD